MSKRNSCDHAVMLERTRRGWSQADLAARSGLPRSSVSAIEQRRLTPSVEAALALARALESSVEALFGEAPAGTAEARWAWEASPASACRYWEAEVGGVRYLYPVESTGGGPGLHDGICRNGVLHSRPVSAAEKTLVMATCDPAVEVLAEAYAATTGFRLKALCRGGAAALDLLKQGKVHVAGLHRSTAERPDANRLTVQAQLGSSFRMMRYAEWQAGIAVSESSRYRTLGTCVKSVKRWARREPGSGARECLEGLLGRSLRGSAAHYSHRAVAEAVRGGWAEAGVCVQLPSLESGLGFLTVREESLDLISAEGFQADPRIASLWRLLRSRSYRERIDELPGYSARCTGECSGVGS